MTNLFEGITELDQPRPLNPSRPTNRFPHPTPHVSTVATVPIELVAA